MVETVHTVWSHAILFHIAVPTLPDGGCTIVDGVKPTGILTLEEQCICYVGHAVIGERGHKNGCAEETRLQAVVMLLEVFPKAIYHIFFCFASKQIIA